ncbi:MAG: hypothetical protein KJO82_04265 [Gammaproteobacteria bacterium]|nr:hypothetical protein [Gammaproteobacteria bacterium]
MRTPNTLICLMLVSIAAVAEAGQLDAMQGLREAQYHRVTARNLDRNYHVLVQLPPDYDESDNETYPTVYLLDGGRNFPLLSTFHQQLLNMEEVPAAILVGISYGADNFEDGNMRSTDYTAKSAERDYWGGAGAFQKFLAEELIPFVESKYRSQAGRRIVFGQSLGGQFVLFTAQTMPDLFWGHIATNPALHRNLPFFLEQPARGKTRPRLFVGSASNESPRFKQPLSRWIEHWAQAATTPWELKVMNLEGHTHLSANPTAYRQGMMWLFSDRP